MLAWDVQGYFEKMTPTYGGASWLVLSTQAASNLLKETGALLSSQYRVRYESLSDGQTPPKLEVRRKGVKFLAGPDAGRDPQAPLTSAFDPGAGPVTLLP